ncbi:MAG: transglycosylase SLT domain-containing protein [Bdellovibrionaceae bacterium]|nr:transglycosylase SLT domain-containing protein [Pseudobdellovibrionaceae bacterium]
MKTTTVIFAILLASTVTFSTHSAMSMGKKIPGEAAEPTPTTPSTPVSSTSDATPLWEAKVSGGKAWSQHLSSSLDTLGKDLLDVVPADSATFCANYKNLSYGQRKEVWMYLISYMAKFESTFNVNSAFTESFSDTSGSKVVSRGLLQISIESGNAYGCNLNTSKDLHDPYQNLDCGVRILNRWLENDGRIAGKVSGGWKGGSRYWSVLRTTSKSYASIASGVSQLSLCQK